MFHIRKGVRSIHGNVATLQRRVVCSGAVAALSSRAIQSLVGRGVSQTRKPTSRHPDYFPFSSSSFKHLKLTHTRTRTSSEQEDYKALLAQMNWPDTFQWFRTVWNKLLGEAPISKCLSFPVRKRRLLLNGVPLLLCSYRSTFSFLFCFFFSVCVCVVVRPFFFFYFIFFGIFFFTLLSAVEFISIAVDIQLPCWRIPVVANVLLTSSSAPFWLIQQTPVNFLAAQFQQRPDRWHRPGKNNITIAPKLLFEMISIRSSLLLAGWEGPLNGFGGLYLVDIYVADSRFANMKFKALWRPRLAGTKVSDWLQCGLEHWR